MQILGGDLLPQAHLRSTCFLGTLAATSFVAFYPTLTFSPLSQPSSIFMRQKLDSFFPVFQVRLNFFSIFLSGIGAIVVKQQLTDR